MHRLSLRCGGKCRPFSISHKRRHTVQTAFCDVPKSHPRPLPMLFLVPKGTIRRMTAPLFPQKHAPRRMTAFLSKKEGTIHHMTASFFFQKCYHLVRSISHLKISYNLNHESPPYFSIYHQHPIHS